MKDEYLQVRQREFNTTMKVLKEYPEGKDDLKPGEKSATAAMLAHTFVMEEQAMQKLLQNEPLGGPMDEPLPTVAQSIEAYKVAFAKTTALIGSMSDDDLQETADFYVGPKTPGKVKKADLLWMFLMDMIHHRGQLTVYLRILGAKVPSIYGPSADEPWT